MARRKRRVTLPKLDRDNQPESSSPHNRQPEDWQDYAAELEPLRGKTRVLAAPPSPKLPKGARQTKTIREPEWTGGMTRAGHQLDTVIDLHGLTEHQAYTFLTEQLQYAQEMGLHRLLVITGKGANPGGVLKQNVPRWLAHDRHGVMHCASAPTELGGEGALLVVLRRK